MAASLNACGYDADLANSSPVRMTERLWEAHDLIVKAWTTTDGPFNWEGRFFNYRHVNIWPRPWQQPHPPIWSAAASPGNARMLGERGYVMAVLGTGWITQLSRTPRLVLSALLVLMVAANTLGIDFGVGSEVKLALASPLPATEQYPDRIILHTTSGFLASAPSRDGDVPGLLGTLRHEGVRTVAWSAEQSRLADFSLEGLVPLARMAGLRPVVTESLEFSNSPSVATLLHESVSARTPPTCTRLSDGTGVWVARYDSSAARLALYCPTRHPQFYDVGSVG